MTSLHAACRNNNVHSVLRILGQGADVNALNQRYHTPLQNAYHVKNIKIVNILLDYGANPNDIFLRAVACNDMKMVKLLLEYGADINTRNQNGTFALYIASINGNIKMMQFLLDAGANINKIKDSSGNTVLLTLSMSRSLKINCIELLLKYGADPNVKNKEGLTPLCCACMYRNIHVVHLLLTYGAQVNCIDGYSSSILHYSIQKGNYQITEMLINCGADVNVQNKFGETSLLQAIKAGRIDLAKLLLDAGANPRIPMTNGKLPIHCAIMNHTLKCDTIHLLLSYGSPINSKYKEQTPLHMIVSNIPSTSYRRTMIDESNIVKLLLENGADPNITTYPDNETALIAAVMRPSYNIDTIKLLLQYGADINFRGKNGYTACDYIHLINRNVPIIKLFIDYNVDISSFTALDSLDTHVSELIHSHLKKRNITALLLHLTQHYTIDAQVLKIISKFIM